MPVYFYTSRHLVRPEIDGIESPPRSFGERLLRDAGGEFIVAACYVAAYLFAPWLSDRMLVMLIVAVALQFFLVTMVVSAITPRGARGIFWSVFGHALILLLLLAACGSADQGEPMNVCVKPIEAKCPA